MLSSFFFPPAYFLLVFNMFLAVVFIAFFLMFNLHFCTLTALDLRAAASISLFLCNDNKEILILILAGKS